MYTYLQNIIIYCRKGMDESIHWVINSVKQNSLYKHPVQRDIT